MAILPIKVYPDPILKKRASEVTEITAEIERLLDDMAETMYDAPGIGLAATQVGSLHRVIVVDLGDDEETGREAKLYKLINPVIVESEGEIEMEEGCLSIPDVREYVRRSESILVSALLPSGEKVEISADGLLAVCIQHEIDHLDGILFIDRLTPLRRELVRSKLKKLRK